MTATELRAVLGLAAVYGVRILGLSLILPVFAVYAHSLPDYSPLMVGLAIGMYGFTQALLQIPLGLLSDRIGRKPVIIGGLLIFALGSVLAANANTLQGIILGRIVQGSGAIAGPVMALTADLTREDVRLLAMAIIGISIGAAFMTSMLLGPTLEQWVGVPGIFWITAIIAICAILVTIFLVPNPQHSVVHRDAEAVPAQFADIVGNKDLLRVNFGIFTMQLLMTSLFLAIPLELRSLGLPSVQHWHVYWPVMLASVIGMLPLIFLAKHARYMKAVFLTGIVVMLFAELALFAWGNSIITLSIWLFLYFAAFNLLEAILPSLVASIAPASAKGTAMGIFTTAQFMGAFCGGLLGGLAQQAWGLHGVFLLGIFVGLLWLLVAAGMSNPRHLVNKMLRVGAINTTQAHDLTTLLRAIPGVVEAVVIIEDELAYLKVDKAILDPIALQALVNPYVAKLS